MKDSSPLKTTVKIPGVVHLIDGGEFPQPIMDFKELSTFNHRYEDWLRWVKPGQCADLNLGCVYTSAVIPFQS